MKMIELFQQDVEIINIDETWISQTDFRRRKWKTSETTNSLPNPLVNPRLSLIVALSNRGDIYFTLSQGNTNLESFKIFMIYLMKKLDAKRPQWRNNTIIQLDGASYHISKQTQEELKVLGFQIIFSAPHSYDAASCELFFAHLKRVDLNPTNEKTGKKQVDISLLFVGRFFSKMVQLVKNRIAQIPKHQLVLYHRHTAKNLIGYLQLQKL